MSKGASFTGGVVFAVVIGGGTAVATNGGSLLIGKGNAATATTGLANSKGTPLSLGAKKGSPPLKVNSTVKVKNLDSDLLDGKDSTAFLGASGTAADSAKLGGQLPSNFLTTTGTAANATKLGGLPPASFLTTTGTAADAAKLGGLPAASYVGAVYAAQTYYYSVPLPKLVNDTDIDTVAVPAGTYLVAFTADLANLDNTNGEFGCHVQATVPGGGFVDGGYGNVSMNPIGAATTTFGATAASQIMNFPAGASVYAYCYVNSGDGSHTSYVYNSTLTATRIQSLNGAAPAVQSAAGPASHASANRKQPLAGH